MEDEDGESKVMDMWSILGEQQLKDPALGNTLKHSVDGSYTDVIEDEKQLLKYNSVGTKDSPSKNSPGSKIVFKGFKKRILAQAQETQTITSRGGTQEHQAPHPNVSPKSAKEKRSEAKRGKITEYAQYLGLQPSSKYNKCTKCNSSSANFCSKQSPPCSCNPMMAPMPSTSDSSTVPHSANFKITRKVYLCAACGTYFENWNLFLHMRDIHKRHICLFCLGMFGQAERLSYHLAKKHSVPEMAFASVEEFYGAFKGSCYLVCCTCEKVFSETDNFYNHFCSPPVKQDVPAPTVCTLCRQSGTHASTCTLASVEPAKEPPREHHTTTVPIGTQTEPAPAHLLDRPPMITPGGKPVPRKPTKNNKPRYVEDGLANSHHYHHPHPHPKLNVHPRKTNAKTPPLSDNGQTGEMIWRHGSFLNNSVRDTVSETIMEVSRYVEEPNEDTAEKREDQADSRDLVTRPSEEESREKVYDTVTQTIMEVSRCGNESEEPEDAREKEESGSTDTLDASDRLDSDFEDSAKTEREGRHSPVSLRPGSAPVREAEDEPDMGKPPERTEERTEEEEEEEEDGGKADSESQGSSSAGQSPVGRSLFSPQHEPQPPTEERPRAEPEDERKRPSGPVESQAAVSFNAVPSSDRSLVIKICTNRNSQFSVTSASTSATEEKTENRREAAAASREPETNNNVEGSGSGSEEKRRPSTAERMRESNGGYGAGNELDSDSDSVKLAVVDTSDQEADEPDEEEEEEEEEEAEEEVDGTVESREEMSEPDHRGQEAARTEEEEQKQAEGTTEASANGGEHEDEEENELVDVVGQDERKDGPGQPSQPSDGIALAGEDVPCVDLNVEGTLDSIEIEELLKRCIEAASPFCVYCNHARHIAVNGRQLGLHMLAEHKFQPQHPAIIIQPEQFTVRVKRSLEELDDRFFNLTSYNSTNGTHNVTDVRTYECFHCRFRSAVHKELYLHNRKMHQKTILICIMCKSTFYSYSELLCHLCPGIYSPNINVKYRCCLCPVTNLPSAFRLMVHLRKRHHACDVCLESTGNQQRLSNHVWKHKLHHLCYRCGIAYRNKPDITKHLFWKHGTESVLCKKCLQKKWPHIYHFCIPPTAFVCEECGSSFSRAVALKVHKRLHSGDQPYTCQECPERFISQKLLGKHEATHREQQTVIDVTMTDPDGQQPTATTVDEERTAVDRERTSTAETATTSASADLAKETKEPVKKVVDVYDLPPLNLSSESDTDTEEEKPEPKEAETAEKPKPGEGNEESSGEPTKSATSPVTVTDSIVDVERNEEEKKHEAQIMDGIWDNFKSYTASLEMKESVGGFPVKEPEPEPETDVAFLRSIVLADHDYCVVWSEKDNQNETDTTKEWGEEQGPTTRTEDGFTGDQDYSVNRAQRSPTGNNLLQSTGETDQAKKKTKTPKKKKQQSGSTSSSDSSSDSDSSSCSCGTNCSCSSSSSGSSSSSSSSSDSDSSGSESSPRKQQQQQSGRKERKKEKEVSQESIATAAVPTETVENKKKEPSTATAPPETENGETIVNVEQTCPARPLLRESDLETDETETDEDFYDEHPQQLANKLLAEKRNQLLLLAAVAPASTDSSMPLNNGITETDSVAPSPDPITAVADEQPQQKRKVKTKKRKKADRSKQRNTVGQTVESIKLNIPKAYYQKSQGFAAGSSSPAVTLQPSRSSTPNLSVNDHHHHQVVGNALSSHLEQQAQQLGIANQSVGGSGSETETKRSSKRKRIPKRFYGDSSDEEADKQPAIKWRKVETPSSFAPVPAPVVKPIPATRLSFGGKTLAYNRPVPAPLPENQTDNLQVTAATSATESEEPADTSTDSSDSEVESTSQPQTQSQPQQTQPHLQLQLQLQMQSQSQSQNQPQSQLQLHQLHQLQTQSQQSQPVQPQPQLQLQPHPQPNQPETTGTTTGPVPTEQRSVNLYCYCQCPYDEVSEMIACDGEDCRIEWFHFECVGIMVPPKGKWYCPDCRKKHGILHNSEDYFD